MEYFKTHFGGLTAIYRTESGQPKGAPAFYIAPVSHMMELSIIASAPEYLKDRYVILSSGMLGIVAKGSASTHTLRILDYASEAEAVTEVMDSPFLSYFGRTWHSYSLLKEGAELLLGTASELNR